MYFSATINYDGGNLRVFKKSSAKGSGKKTVESAKGSGECERQWGVVRGGETVVSAKGSGETVVSAKGSGETVESGEWRVARNSGQW